MPLFVFDSDLGSHDSHVDRVVLDFHSDRIRVAQRSIRVQTQPRLRVVVLLLFGLVGDGRNQQHGILPVVGVDHLGVQRSTTHVGYEIPK